VKKGEVLSEWIRNLMWTSFTMPQSAYAEAEVRTATAILQTTQTGEFSQRTGAKLWKRK